MHTPRLDQQALDFLRAIARGPEGAIWREKVLKPWLASVDQSLRKAGEREFLQAQGEAHVLEHLLNLCSVKAPAPLPKMTTRKLVISGVAQEFGIPNKTGSWDA